jgi:hypothetical protein
MSPTKPSKSLWQQIKAEPILTLLFAVSSVTLGYTVRTSSHLATLDERVKKGEMAFDSVSNRTWIFYTSLGHVEELLAWKRSIEEGRVPDRQKTETP